VYIGFTRVGTRTGGDALRNFAYAVDRPSVGKFEFFRISVRLYLRDIAYEVEML
jgi:hypothetical protein